MSAATVASLQWPEGASSSDFFLLPPVGVDVVQYVGNAVSSVLGTFPTESTPSGFYLHLPVHPELFNDDEEHVNRSPSGPVLGEPSGKDDTSWVGTLISQDCDTTVAWLKITHGGTTHDCAATARVSFVCGSEERGNMIAEAELLSAIDREPDLEGPGSFTARTPINQIMVVRPDFELLIPEAQACP